MPALFMKMEGVNDSFILKTTVMKRDLLTTSVVALFAIIITSCNSNPMSMHPAPVYDTTGLAQFQEWKAREAAIKEAEAMAAMQEQMAKSTTKKTTPAKTYSMVSESVNEAKVAKKKGWSKSAKYGVAGAAGGGILGAVIHKRDPVKGAIAGAIILGGGGYIFGRSQDKKDGRL